MVSVCTYCGVGCEIEAVTKNGKIEKILPVKGGVSSGGSLCIKGKYGFQFLEKRLNTHLVSVEFVEREAPKMPLPLQIRLANLQPYDHRFYSAPLSLALDLAAWKLEELKKRYGGKAIAGIGGARTSLESAWLFQKFIRESVGSPHIDNCARVCHAPSLKGLKRTIGEGASSLPFEAISKAGTIFVIGSNTTEAHPMVAKRIIEAKKRGAKLVVVDVREIELMKFADIKVVLPFETNLLFLNLLAREVIERGLIDTTFIEERCVGFEEYKRQLLKEPISKEIFVEGGFPEVARQIEEIATLLTRPTQFLWGLGVTEHLDGSDAVSAIANLALLTGNFSERSGVMPLRGQNNVQGACDVGCLPYYLPDYLPPVEEGWKTPEIIEQILAGQIRGVINMGEDLSHIHPHRSKTAAALRKLEFLAVLEVMESDVVNYADIVFAVKSGYEKYGVYVNAERRLHLAVPLVESPLPDDWEVIQGLENRLTGRFKFDSSREVLEKGIAKETTRFAGATYSRLKRKPLQWPISPDGVDTPALHLRRFATSDGKGHFYYAPWQRRGELADRLSGKRRWYLTTGRHLAQYNNSVQTTPSPTLSKRYPIDLVWANPVHREELGGRIRLKSRYGESGVLEVKYSEKVRPFTLYATFHFPESGINFLFGEEGDRWTKTARFKSVEVEPIPIETEQPEKGK